jgi:hypothetical protein
MEKRIPDAFYREKYIGSKYEWIPPVTSEDDPVDRLFVTPEKVEEDDFRPKPDHSKLFDIISKAKKTIKKIS